jgi:hypothetical protein
MGIILGAEFSESSISYSSSAASSGSEFSELGAKGSGAPEGATLRVMPDGRAKIVSRNARAAPSKEQVTGKPAREPVAAGIQAKNLADVAEKMLGLRDRNPRDRALLKQYLETGGHGMDPADVNWCAAFVSATVHHAGLPDLPGSKGNVASNYLNWGTKVSPEDVRRGDIAVGGRRAGELGGHDAIVTTCQVSDSGH